MKRMFLVALARRPLGRASVLLAVTVKSSFERLKMEDEEPARASDDPDRPVTGVEPSGPEEEAEEEGEVDADVDAYADNGANFVCAGSLSRICINVSFVGFPAGIE